MNVFLDSGAYSAYTKKIEININNYIAYIYKNKKYLTVYANLDVIGSAAETWKNQKIMENAGLNPLPVFHMNDNIKYLYKCMKYDYFALGAMAKATMKKKVIFLDKIFDIVCNQEKIPNNKIHAFGMTSFELLRRYPFYSADSTSWLIYGIMGKILIPPKIKGKFRYNINPIILSISDKSNCTSAFKHYDTLNKEQRKNIDEYIKLKGYTLGIKGIKDDNNGGGLYSGRISRLKFNAQYYLDFINTLPQWPWTFKIKKRKVLI